MTHTTLGLDVGPNSIGWALIDEPNRQIIAAGVRVFPEGVDNFDTKKEKSRNEDRRTARGMRRQIARRSRRKRRLLQALAQVGLFPADQRDQQSLFALDPYELRAKALDSALTPHEIGRVLLHLNQRRGFLSNRKKDRGDSEVKGMLEEISNLASQIMDSGADTLGQYLFQKVQFMDHSQRVKNDNVRKRHTRRDMLEHEFDAIWDAQRQFHSNLLTDELRYGKQGRKNYPCKPSRKTSGSTDLEDFGLHGLIFFQRRMYWPKSVVGLCELEPNEKRCQKSDRRAQKFRVLQDVNNLRYVAPETLRENSLNAEQRTLLLEFLSKREKGTFDEIRKKLGFLDSIKFNLERGERSTIKGMTTDWALAKAVGKDWHDLAEDDKDCIVRMLLDNEREDDQIAKVLVDNFGFDPGRADRALAVDLPAGYVNLSLKAINKLLPHLERGLVYQSVNDPECSALHAAGYLRRDELQRRLFDRLPDLARVGARDCRIGDIPNPVVKRTLVELRKVVNAIIRTYGKPAAIHVEMARSVKMGPKARKEYNARNRQREDDRNRAKEAIKAYSDDPKREFVPVNRDTILRFLLWEEQRHQCVYCQQSISQQQLFGGDADIDHILPYSRCLDDSQANKVVAHRECNNEKRQQTPYEWLAGRSPSRYEHLCQHVAKLMGEGRMTYGKYRKFLQKELDLDGFIARQLTDTAYISRATAEYLRLLFEHPHDVLGLKGQHTAELRHQWGLNNVLRHDDVDRKNRDDHRHHAVDAIVVALTDRARLKQLSQATMEIEWTEVESGEVQLRRKYCGGRIMEPWESFRQDVESAVNAINVSHRCERKVAGALHEDTYYGPTESEGVFVTRKELEALSTNEIAQIRDDRVRQAVEARLAEHGIEIGRGKKVDSRKWKAALGDESHPILLPPSAKRLRKDPDAAGIPIKRVRVLKKEKTIRPIRAGKPDQVAVKPGATHHLCIFEWQAGKKRKREAVFVTQLEAINRIKQQQHALGQLLAQWSQSGIGHREIERRKREAMREIAHTFPVIDRRPPVAHPTIPSDARFVMSLSRGEMVLANWKGEEVLLVFRTAASTQGQIYFAMHTDSRPSSQYAKCVVNANTLDGRKVTLDPVGRIRWAND